MVSEVEQAAGASRLAAGNEWINAYKGEFVGKEMF
jgi:hypothetical protein